MASNSSYANRCRESEVDDNAFFQQTATTSRRMSEAEPIDMSIFRANAMPNMEVEVSPLSQCEEAGPVQRAGMRDSVDSGVSNVRGYTIRQLPKPPSSRENARKPVLYKDFPEIPNIEIILRTESFNRMDYMVIALTAFIVLGIGFFLLTIYDYLTDRSSTEATSPSANDTMLPKVELDSTLYVN